MQWKLSFKVNNCILLSNKDIQPYRPSIENNNDMFYVWQTHLEQQVPERRTDGSEYREAG